MSSPLLVQQPVRRRRRRRRIRRTVVVVIVVSLLLQQLLQLFFLVLTVEGFTVLTTTTTTTRRRIRNTRSAGTIAASEVIIKNIRFHSRSSLLLSSSPADNTILIASSLSSISSSLSSSIIFARRWLSIDDENNSNDDEEEEQQQQQGGGAGGDNSNKKNDTASSSSSSFFSTLLPEAVVPAAVAKEKKINTTNAGGDDDDDDGDDSSGDQLLQTTTVSSTPTMTRMKSMETNLYGDDELQSILQLHEQISSTMNKNNKKNKNKKGRTETTTIEDYHSKKISKTNTTTTTTTTTSTADASPPPSVVPSFHDLVLETIADIENNSNNNNEEEEANYKQHVDQEEEEEVRSSSTTTATETTTETTVASLDDWRQYVEFINPSFLAKHTNRTNARRGGVGFDDIELQPKTNVVDEIDNDAIITEKLRMAVSNIRAIATDVDGTLLSSDHTLHPRTLRAIERAVVMKKNDGTTTEDDRKQQQRSTSSFHIFPATGKTRIGALRSLGPIAGKLLSNCPGVYIQGLYCLDEYGNIVYERKLPIAAIHDVQKNVAEMYNITMFGYDGDDIYYVTNCTSTKHIYEFHNKWGEPMPKQLIEIAEGVGKGKGESDESSSSLSSSFAKYKNGMHKVLLMDDDIVYMNDIIRPKLEELASEHDCVVTQAVPTMLELLPANSSKGIGVYELCKRCTSLNITDVTTQLLSIGDAENDIDMLQQYSSIGIVVNNACISARNSSDIILSKTNNQGGAGIAIELFGNL